MRINEKLIGLSIILLGLLGLFWGWFRQGQEVASSKAVEPVVDVPKVQVERKREPCRVVTVYDGDTLGCDLNADGRIQRPGEIIRLLGVDTPEMHYSRKNKSHGTDKPVDEPFAKEASEWLTTKTQGKTVYLVFDWRRNDRYGRTLAHVYSSATDETPINQDLLRTGYATTLFLGGNRLYEAEYHQAEADARRAKRGLWAYSEAGSKR